MGGGFGAIIAKAAAARSVRVGVGPAHFERGPVGRAGVNPVEKGLRRFYGIPSAGPSRPFP